VPVSDDRFSIVSDVVVVPRCVVVLFSWVSGQLVTWFFLLVSLYHPNTLMDLCLSLLMERRGLRT